MINKEKVYGLLGLTAKAGRIVSGTEAVEEKIYKRKIKLLVLAEDASEKTRNNFKLLGEKYKIPIITLGNIQEISKSIGKENKAVIGIKDKNLAAAIENIVYGGDTIG